MASNANIFLKIGKIKGESVVDDYKDTIEVYSTDWGIHRAGSGRPSVQEIGLTMSADLASPVLMLACLTGEHIDSAKIMETKSGGKKSLEFSTFTLSKVFVSSWHVSGGSHGDGATLQLTLNFNEVQVSYTSQAEGGGKGKTAVFEYKIRESKRK